MTTELATRSCAPCEGGTEPMTLDRVATYMSAVPGWRLVEGERPKIERKFKFKNFAGAMAFVNSVAEVAESEGHHPDVCISWNRVALELVTHAIGGLSENDFIMAAKIDRIAASGSQS